MVTTASASAGVACRSWSFIIIALLSTNDWQEIDIDQWDQHYMTKHMGQM